jgi:hypothetical protein
LDHHTKEHAIDGSCITYEEDEKYVQDVGGKICRKHLEELDMSEKTVFKMDLKYIGWEARNGLNLPRKDANDRPLSTVLMNRVP